MPHRSDVHEEWAIYYLEKLVELSEANRDALPGTVVKLVKQAITIMKKRRRA